MAKNATSVRLSSGRTCLRADKHRHYMVDLTSRASIMALGELLGTAPTLAVASGPDAKTAWWHQPAPAAPSRSPHADDSDFTPGAGAGARAGPDGDLDRDHGGRSGHDCSNLDADCTLPGQQTFRWVGKAVLAGAAQLDYYISGGNTIVRGSTDADAAAEVEIQLSGVKLLTPSDFRL